MKRKNICKPLHLIYFYFIFTYLAQAQQSIFCPDTIQAKTGVYKFSSNSIFDNISDGNFPFEMFVLKPNRGYTSCSSLLHSACFYSTKDQRTGELLTFLFLHTQYLNIIKLLELPKLCTFLFPRNTVGSFQNETWKQICFEVKNWAHKFQSVKSIAMICFEKHLPWWNTICIWIFHLSYIFHRNCASVQVFEAQFFIKNLSHVIGPFNIWNDYVFELLQAIFLCIFSNLACFRLKFWFDSLSKDWHTG